MITLPAVPDDDGIEWVKLSVHMFQNSKLLGRSCVCTIIASLLCVAVFPATAREKDAKDYGTGLITNIPLPESEVAKVVSEVAQNGIIRGTKEYEKDEYISGAKAMPSSNLFGRWTEGGQVFYKVRKEALDPRNFKDSNDMGTIAVRYVVQPQREQNTVVRIDALFVEDFRRTVHPSNGTVESSEYKVIQQHLDEIELMKKKSAEMEQQRQERLAKKNFRMVEETPVPAVSSAPPFSAERPAAKESERETQASLPGETLEEHVARLRKDLQRLVKAPGAPLKSAPFHSASTLKTLPSGTEVLIIITTPYWFGVETHDGQHGWISREQLDLLP